jgi:TonB family protein
LTDLDGKFTLTGLKKDDVIQVSFVGFQTRSVIVKDESPLTILLDDAVQNLDEMTVVGYASNGVGAPSSDSDKKVVAVVDIPKVKETPQEKVIFQVVEEMPEFPGGMAEAMKFLAKNIKYPVAAQQAKIEGRVIVQFVIERDGSVSDVKVMRGVNPELDAEAIRVVSMMPNWIPGKQRGKAVAVKYTMPIMFRLQNPKPEKEETASLQQINLKVDKDASSENVAMVKDVLREGYREMIMEFPQGVNKSVEKLPSGGVRYHSDHRITMRVENGKSPLIIVDGKEMDKGLDIMKEIPVNQIETVSIMKDKDAIAKYGEKAKDGVIEIETKKNKK